MNFFQQALIELSFRISNFSSNLLMKVSNIYTIHGAEPFLIRIKTR